MPIDHIELLDVAHRYAQRAGLNREDAEDCAAEFLLHMLHGDRSAELDLCMTEMRFLLACLKNFTRSYRRDLSRREARELSTDIVDLDRMLADRGHLVDDAAAEALRREFWHQLIVAMRPLTRRQQTLLLLHYVQGSSAAAIARRDGRTVHSVEQALVRARRSLRKVLGHTGAAETDLLTFLMPGRRDR